MKARANRGCTCRGGRKPATKGEVRAPVLEVRHRIGGFIRRRAYIQHQTFPPFRKREKTRKSEAGLLSRTPTTQLRLHPHGHSQAELFRCRRLTGDPRCRQSCYPSRFRPHRRETLQFKTSLTDSRGSWRLSVYSVHIPSHVPVPNPGTLPSPLAAC